jgi:hypothetical protein
VATRNQESMVPSRRFQKDAKVEAVMEFAIFISV